MQAKYKEIIDLCVQWIAFHEDIRSKPERPITYRLDQMLHAARYLRNCNRQRQLRTGKGRKLELFIVPNDELLAGLYLASRVTGKDPEEKALSSFVCANGNYVMIATPKSGDHQKPSDSRQLSLIDEINELDQSKKS